MSDEAETKEAVTPEAPGAEKTPGKKKKSMMSKLKWILILGVGGIVALVAVVVVATKGASDAAASIINNIQTENCSEVYNTQVTASFQEQGTLEDWNTNCVRISGVLTGVPDQKGVNVQGNSGEASTSEVNFEIAGSDGNTYLVMIGMIKDEGVWKMDIFDSDLVPGSEVQPADPEDAEEV